LSIIERPKFSRLFCLLVTPIPVSLTIIPGQWWKYMYYGMVALTSQPQSSMEKISKIESVIQFNRDRGQKTLHPLVSVLDQSLSGPVKEARYLSGLYIIFLKDTKCEELK
jgi:hypothetical protein